MRLGSWYLQKETYRYKNRVELEQFSSQRPRSFWSAPRIATSGQVLTSDIPVLNGFVNTIDWDQNQSDLSDLTLSIRTVQWREVHESRTSGVGPGQRSRFLVLTKRPQERGPWGREWVGTRWKRWFRLRGKLNDKDPNKSFELPEGNELRQSPCEISFSQQETSKTGNFKFVQERNSALDWQVEHTSLFNCISPLRKRCFLTMFPFKVHSISDTYSYFILLF